MVATQQEITEEELKRAILKFIPLGRKAVHLSKLIDHINEMYPLATKEQKQGALNSLFQEGRIGCNESNWLWQIEIIEVTDQDDEEWLTGTGYYSQD